jgi:CHAT domain-containing protein
LGNARIDDSKRASSEFLAREEQLRHENIIIERQLGQESAKPGPEMSSDRIATLQSRLVAVRASYEALLNQLKLSNATYASLLSISPITLTEAQQHIDSDTTIVSYFTTPDTTFAFVLTKNRFRLTKLHVSAADLYHDVAVFRDFSGENGVSPSLRNLYKSLIAPLRSELKTKKLVLIPYGVLHDLPFGALTPDGHHFLGDEQAISYLPSVSALSYLHAKENPGTGGALVLVNDQGEGLPRLNYPVDEARAASILGAEQWWARRLQRRYCVGKPQTMPFSTSWGISKLIRKIRCHQRLYRVRATRTMVPWIWRLCTAWPCAILI